MINPNKFANQKIQELGQNLFQGEEFAQQVANKELSQPVPPPGSIPQSPYGDINPIMNKDSREARRQERKSIREANKGLRQARRERAKGVKEQGQENYSYDGYEKGRYNKKGDDIEYGKTPRYSKKNPPLNQNDPSLKAKPERVRKQKEVAEVLPEKTYRKSSGKRIHRSGKAQEQVREFSKKMQEPKELKTPFNLDDPKSKYKTVNVQDLEDMGRVKSDKKGKYVVNSDEMKTGSSRDTLRLPRGAKHYTGRKYKTGEMIDESDFEDFAKDVNKK
tara:strand:- start:464 stop:1291 length:828 start_codon:yes stop_codon:yes gene_type:complete